MLGKIAMDELGITAGIDCFTKGDIGACAETALTLISSVVGGVAGKIITKYAWRWGKAAKLAKSLYKLGADLVEGIQGFIKTEREVTAAGRRVEEIASCALSFTADTPVVMADGSTKPIKDVVVGDTVLATDTKTGKNTKRTVQTLFINQDTDLYDVVVKTKHGTGVIHTTESHPFWDQTTRSWIKAVDLTSKARLRTADGGTGTLLTAVRPAVRTGSMWDLTIETDHDFFVGVNDASVLVHNCGKNQGVYEFADMHNPGETYVGKTINLSSRLAAHLNSGWLASMDAVKITHVCGCEDDVFVAEHLRIAHLRKQGVPLSNDLSSPGKAILEKRNQPMLPGAEEWGQ
jgi:hypothetical protein